MNNNPLLEELLDCTFEALLEQPGLRKEELASVLVTTFPCETDDAMADTNADIQTIVEAVWASEYTDNSGTTMPISEWADKLRDQDAVSRYLSTI